MTPTLIISYDDTANDRDALALARMLADAGAAVELAYVRHRPEPERHSEGSRPPARPRRCSSRGAEALGVPHAPRHVVMHGSTGDGLRRLAEREEAERRRLRLRLPHPGRLRAAGDVGATAAVRRPGGRRPGRPA